MKVYLIANERVTARIKDRLQLEKANKADVALIVRDDGTEAANAIGSVIRRERMPMGEWGVGIFSDDVAETVRFLFNDFINGYTAEEATQMLVESRLNRNDANTMINPLRLVISASSSNLGTSQHDFPITFIILCNLNITSYGQTFITKGIGMLGFSRPGPCMFVQWSRRLFFLSKPAMMVAR